MKTKRREIVLRLMILVAVIAIGLSLHRFLSHVESKHVATNVTPSVHAALRQLQVATLKFWQVNGRLPASLDDLVGISVPPSSGAFIPFSKEGLERELGENKAGFVFIPASVPRYPATPTNVIVVAYASESADSNLCLVLLSNGEISRMSRSNVNVLVDQINVNDAVSLRAKPARELRVRIGHF